MLYLCIENFADLVGGIVHGELRYFPEEGGVHSLEETVAPPLLPNQIDYITMKLMVHQDREMTGR